MTHTFSRFLLAASLLAGAVPFTAAPAAAAESARDVFDAATKAYHEGTKCLAAGRKKGANQFLENEKAIGHLEQAQRLMERYLELKPSDSEAERMMSDILSLLFWCHKMSPMVDPDEIEPNDEDLDDEPVDDDPEPTGPSAEELEAKRKAAEEAKAKAAAEEAKAKEGEAQAALEKARKYRDENPKDGMNALAKFFQVAESYPGTKAGAEAKQEADALQEKLFAVKPVIPQRPKKLPPLTMDDKKEIEKELKGWLSNRMKVHCASCNGAGYSECKKCDGSGKIRGRAGRVSTCRKCKRGKIACSRRNCSEGVDTRFLSKVVIQSRAPYYQEKLKALLGGGKKAIDLFLVALAAQLSESPGAPAAITRCATELGITPVQLRDIITNHGPSQQIVAEFKAYSVDKIGRKTSYTLKGKSNARETVTFEKTPDGEWFLRDFE
jgi:hypothetical protein